MELKNYFVQDALGNIVPNPTAYVYVVGSSPPVLATGLKNAAGEAISNPFTGTAQGQLQFRAPDAEYDLRVVASGRDFTMRVQFSDVNGVARVADLVLPSGSAGIGYIADFTDAQGRDVRDKLRERRSILDALPSGVRAAVVAGTNMADLAPYINKALAAGGTIDTLGYTYAIGSRLVPAVGTRLIGRGTFKALSAFSDAAAVDGMNMLLQVVSGLNVESGITFDGNSITTAGFWLYGARNKSAVTGVTLDCTFKNVSFTGIDISRNGGSWANSTIKVRGRAENCGWIGINLEGIEDLDHTGASVYRTGWHAMFVSHCSRVNGSRTITSKSVPPYRIFNGAGSAGGVEKGFLFGHFSVFDAVWTGLQLYDNRNALEDGFGIGEDGSISDPESANIYVTGQIFDAGQFGFDASSNMKAKVQVFRSLKQGVQLGFDLGGSLANVDIEADVFDVVEDEAVRFSATGAALRSCSTTSGSNSITINSGSGFYVVPGQRITGPGMPAGAYVGTVVGSTVTMVTTEGGSSPANATATSGSASLTFRGSIKFTNCRVKVNAAGCPYGVGVESGADGYAQYSNCEVTGDLSSVTGTSVRQLNGNYPAGLRVKPNKWKEFAASKSGSAFSVTDNDRFVLISGGQLNSIIGGYDGQEIEVYAQDNTLLNFDWTNSSSYGDARLIGNGNVDLTLNSGGMFRAVKRASNGWYVHTITQAQ